MPRWSDDEQRFAREFQKSAGFGRPEVGLKDRRHPPWAGAPAGLCLQRQRRRVLDRASRPVGISLDRPRHHHFTGGRAARPPTSNDRPQGHEWPAPRCWPHRSWISSPRPDVLGRARTKIRRAAQADALLHGAAGRCQAAARSEQGGDGPLSAGDAQVLSRRAAAGCSEGRRQGRRDPESIGWHACSATTGSEQLQEQHDVFQENDPANGSGQGRPMINSDGGGHRFSRPKMRECQERFLSPVSMNPL